MAGGLLPLGQGEGCTSFRCPNKSYAYKIQTLFAACTYLFYNKVYMGNNQRSNGRDDKRSLGREYALSGYGSSSSGITYKRHRKVEQIKALILWSGDVLGISFTAFGFVTTINNVKEAVIFILGITWALCRLYFYIRRQWILLRKEQMEQRQREIENERFNNN